MNTLIFKAKKGYGSIAPSYAVTFALAQDDLLKPTLTGIPNSLRNIKFYRVTTGETQLFYQQYLAGKLTREWLDQRRVKFDSKDLQKTPMKVATYILTGENAAGKSIWIADTDGDLNFNREPIHPLITYAIERHADIAANAGTITVQRVERGQIKTYKVPFALCSGSEKDQIYYNFPQYWEAIPNIGQAVLLHFLNFLDYFPRATTTSLVTVSLPRTNREIQPSESIKLGDYLTLGKDVYRADSISLETLEEPLITLEPANNSQQAQSPQVGYLAPVFQEKEFVNDSLLSLQSLRGKYVLLDFWATWCGPCIAEFPHLKKLTEQYGINKFEVIGIIGDSKATSVREKLASKGVSWRQILSDKIVNQYKVSSFPTIFLINPDGRIVHKDLKGEALDKVLAELVK